MKRLKEWQRMNAAPEQQVRDAIAFVETTIQWTQRQGLKPGRFRIGLDRAQPIVDRVQAHYNNDDRDIQVYQSFNHTGGVS